MATIDITSTGATVINLQAGISVIDINAAVNVTNTTGGGSGSDKNYVQSFTNQSSVTVNHNLGKLPAVTVLNSANDSVEVFVNHINTNQLIITAIGSFTGKVICN